jgi:predicted HTH transcriptional regulator
MANSKQQMDHTHHIQNLIAEGEHQQLDFKFEISDARRIARTLVAFANTDGGRLLIGVKDNGAIAGMRSDEEFYMVEAAAKMYCKPQVEFDLKEWTVNGKKVLEIIIKKKYSKTSLCCS